MTAPDSPQAATGGKPVTPARIMDLASAYFGSCILFTAVDLGVFGALARTGPAGAAQLAGELATDLRGLTLLLDGAVAVGLLAKQDELYRNTPEAEAFLTPGRPGDLSAALRYNRDVYPAWGRLTELAKTGRPVEAPSLHLGADEARTRTFVLSMHGRASAIGRAVTPRLQLQGKTHLLDVGGGPGTYAVLAARAFPGLRCTVLDLPAVVAIAAQLIEQQGSSASVSTLPGDYHTTEFPAGIDAVNFFGMLHQESPDSIRDLMRRAYQALPSGGVVHVMDMMTDATHTSPPFSALFGINMALTKEDGWVFSDAELKGWMEEAGFTGFTVEPLPPPMPHWLARAWKP